METRRSPGKGGRGPEIYVGNLPYDVTEDEILFFLKDFNPIHARKVKKDLKCFAFVQMSSEENALRAIEKLNQSVLRGRPLVLRVFTLAQQVAPTWTPNGSGDPHDTDSIGTDRLFISNLPCDVTKVDLCELFQDFKLERIKIINREDYSFAFVTLRSVEDARMAICQTHGIIYRDRRVSCKAFHQKKKDSSISEDFEDVSVSSMKSDPRDREAPDSPSGQEENEIYLDDLQKDGAMVTSRDPTPQHRDLGSSGDRFILRLRERRTASVHQEPHEAIRPGSVEVDAVDDAVRVVEPCNGSVYIGSRLNQSSVTTDPRLSKRAAEPIPELTPGSAQDPQDSQTVLEEVTAARNRLLIPVEMRGPFLAEMLRGCFGDLSWLEDLMEGSGELSLLVTSTYPDTDYFWATLLTQETYLTLSNICMSLAQAQPQLPCLMKDDIQRGARCMGRCALTDGEQGTWSRCWVADVATGLAVVFFVDYGVTNVVPISTLRSLDDDQYWSIPPIALPFLLLEGRDVDEPLVGTIFRGRACGTCTRQRHILKFCPYPKDD